MTTIGQDGSPSGQQTNNTNDAPGGRHSNDFKSINDISILPTRDEIAQSGKNNEFLPPTDWSQPHLVYPSDRDRAKRHIDCAFRPLRQAIFCPFQEAVRPYLKDGSIVEANKVGTCWAGYIYQGQISHVMVKPKVGLEAQLSFHESTSSAHTPYATNVKSLLLFVVTEKENPRIGTGDRMPMVTVRLASEYSSQVLFLSRLYVNQQFGHFISVFNLKPEAFLPTLENLQPMMKEGGMAFSKWFLPPPDPDNSNSQLIPPPILPPAYARLRNIPFRLDSIRTDYLGSTSKKRKIYINPKQLDEVDLEAVEKATGLDPGQSRALVAALTREYILIQGPPGSGKTHLGVRLLKVLVDYKSDVEAQLGPIVVICCTNHTLDRFLKHAVDLHINKMVRIGVEGHAEEIRVINGKEVSRARLAIEQLSQETDKEVEVKLKSAKGHLKHIVAARYNAVRGYFVEDDLRRLLDFLTKKYPNIGAQFGNCLDLGAQFDNCLDRLATWLECGKPQTEIRDVGVLLLEAENDVTSLSGDERDLLAKVWRSEMVTQQSEALFACLDRANKRRQTIRNNNSKKTDPHPSSSTRMLSG
ncbi:hypothetical protein QBC38DRAFT_549123 [Podospora fimiseda]|uniref:DNA2/NAM7 helicase helicase domain-containing protein n=1 Tax=Podospora fimiseda TaxID=252190 RepID=A0AAN6YQ48_9PEZI|nr:hypothetical protein QBC38DRAFT_549123 [Podospora fimiseda]